MVAAQYCSPGAAAICDRVLLIGAMNPTLIEGVSSANQLTDVRDTLTGTGAFTVIDTFDARNASDGGAGTPSAALLAGYDAVLVFSTTLFEDAGLLGDRLAAYHDQGGGIVVAAGANFVNERLRGAYGAVANGYALMDYATGWYADSSDGLGEKAEPESPLLRDVASLISTSWSFHSTASVVAGRGVVVAKWRGGHPLVLRGTRGNRTLVELNFWPISSRIFPTLWQGDGGPLLRNALKFSRCMLCGPGTYADAGEQGGGVCVKGLSGLVGAGLVVVFDLISCSCTPCPAGGYFAGKGARLSLAKARTCPGGVILVCNLSMQSSMNFND
jgi:hypothetical protein